MLQAEHGTDRARQAMLALTALCLAALASGCAPATAPTTSAAPETPAALERSEELQQILMAYARPDEIFFPADNPYSEAKVELGKQLFFDPRLSGQNNLSCASCHHPGMAWEDGQATSLGTPMTRLDRNTPTIQNLAWTPFLFWDGRAGSLEEQALMPITSDVEMAQHAGELVEEINAIPGYVSAFEEIFPEEGVSEDTIAKAIATYERTVISADTPFDRWVAGDEDAISDLAKAGFDVFTGKGRCSTCHAGWNFTDNAFHDIGLKTDDVGRYEVTRDPADLHAFKTPSLRNTELRAPYMHDGSFTRMIDVINHYVDGFEERPSLSPLLEPVELSNDEKFQLFTFMKSLTSQDEPVAIPNLPISVPRVTGNLAPQAASEPQD